MTVGKEAVQASNNPTAPLQFNDPKAARRRLAPAVRRLLLPQTEMRLSYFSVFLYLHLFGCISRGQSDTIDFSHDDLLLYIEARSARGTMDGRFGDVTMLDPTSKVKFYVTNDDYYDADPVWSPDRRSILFISNRRGGNLLLQIKGIGGPHEMYRFDISTKETHRFDESLILNAPTSFGGIYDPPCWSTDGRSLLFQDVNKIYRFDIAAKVVRLVATIGNESYSISEMRLSPNGRLLAFEYDTTYNQNSHPLWYRLGILDLTDSTFRHVTNEVADFCGWHPDGDRLLVRIPSQGGSYDESRFFHYSHRRARLEESDLPLALYSPRYLSDGRLVGLACPDTTKPDNSEILLFDPATGQKQWLTSDGLEKRSLSTYLPPVK
jgi:hypothetical protein